MKCRICSGSNTVKFLSLGHQPLSDIFFTEEKLNEPQVSYPLDIYFCEDCKLVQLAYTVYQNVLFDEGEYAFTTGTSKALVENFSKLTEDLTKRFNLSEKDLAVDIGSNDGTLLEGFLKFGVRVLGVEPTNIIDIALAKNIPTLKKFFNMEIASDIVKNHGNAKVITAMNVFAHIDDIHGVVESIKLLLTDDGVFVSESHHLLSLIKMMQYDSIYHEHLRYYSLKPMIKLFEMHDMDVFDAELITTHGGSIRVYACKKGAYKILDSVRKVIGIEEKAGLYDKKTFLGYGKNVSEHRHELMELLMRLKKEGNKIVAIGAPAKGNTLLNYCGINSDILDYVVERSKLKIGKYYSGMHIKVEDEEKIFEDQPEYALLLSWNLKDFIIPKLREKGYNGKIIVPFPRVEII